jgi:nucleoside-diphosphate-sugar epimerase
MRVLILGGTGLISTAITAQLLEAGASVSHFNRGRTPNPFGDRVRTLHGERSDRAGLEAARAAAEPDVVIDMICFTPEEAEVGVDAFAGRVGRYLMCSTVDVFTKPAPALPVTEASERSPSPTFPYAFRKARAEAVVEAAHAGGRLSATILRPAATYVDLAVPSIGSFDLALERLRAGRPIVVHGDGTAIWAACHRDDVARAFVAACSAEAAPGRAYNLAGTELLTWNAYWQAVGAAIGIEPRLLHIPTDVLGACAPTFAEWCVENFQHDNIYDVGAAARDLGFRSTVRWAEGIARGLPGRIPRPVDPAERGLYEAIVQAWEGATTRMRDEVAATAGAMRPAT